MEHIVPCRTHISDRFPVASFVVRVPPGRLFEVACATAPDLFHRDREGQRTRSNFFTTRWGGLLPAPMGEATCLIPHDQLRQFAGAERIYYALASYGDPRGGDAHFSIAPDSLDRVPFVELASDFTGRGLDRSRLGLSVPSASASYGASGARLRWGGDDALEALAAQGRGHEASPETGEPPYDDGYDSALWDGRALSEGADAPLDEASAGEPAWAEPSGAELGSDSFEGAAMDFSSAPPLDSEPGWEDGAEAAAAAEGPADDELGESYEDARDYYGKVVSDSARDEAADGSAELDSGGPPEGADGHTPEALGLAEHEYRDDDVEEELAKGSASQALGLVPLEISEKVRLLRILARAESGQAGYAAINPDREYSMPSHPAYRRYHIGLSFGFIQFTQRSGNLGKVLRKAKEREERLRREGSLAPEQAFERLFGPHAEELLRVTNAPSEDERVAPVGGKLLWESEWTSRFTAAGAVDYVQNAQNEVAVTSFVDPNLPIAKLIGFDTPRSLCMLLDRCIQMGNGGGLSFVMRAIGPIQNEAQLEQALRALGAAELRAFQARFPDVLQPNGRWTARVHAALLSALRGLGERSPFVIPDRPALLHRLLDAASGRRFQARLRRLYESERDFGPIGQESGAGATTYAIA